MAAPGWYGKLPTLGDFASRRLEPGFVQAWDDWLAHGLAQMRLSETWLEHYLASPSWRFLVMPGALPGEPGLSAWAGVLMPSVDRVGRYFPLTIAQPLPALPTRGDEVEALWRWLLQLDEAALDALQLDWTVEQLEDELARIGAAPPVQAAHAQGRPTALPGIQHWPLDGYRHAGDLFGALAARPWLDTQHGASWWLSAADVGTPRLLQAEGLPAANLALALFGPVADEAALA
jgi:type VI secretion system protein ImpM